MDPTWVLNPLSASGSFPPFRGTQNKKRASIPRLLPDAGDVPRYAKEMVGIHPLVEQLKSKILKSCTGLYL